jgi:hypothetical protein
MSIICIGLATNSQLRNRVMFFEHVYIFLLHLETLIFNFLTIKTFLMMIFICLGQELSCK